MQGWQPEVRTYNTAIIACNMCNQSEEALQVSHYPVLQSFQERLCVKQKRKICAGRRGLWEVPDSPMVSRPLEGVQGFEGGGGPEALILFSKPTNGRQACHLYCSAVAAVLWTPPAAFGVHDDALLQTFTWHRYDSTCCHCKLCHQNRKRACLRVSVKHLSLQLLS